METRMAKKITENNDVAQLARETLREHKAVFERIFSIVTQSKMKGKGADVDRQRSYKKQ